MPCHKALTLAVSAWLANLARTLRRWPWRDTAITLGQRFREDRLGLSAGSLTFTTLIALVPLVTVMLAVFTAFPMFGSFQGALEKYFLQSLVPDSIARPVLRALTQFAAKARGIGAVGLLLLVVTALSMMFTIDRTLNGIWRVRRPRPLAQRILVYWAALTLGPLAIGVSLSATSWALSANKGLVAALPGGVNLVFDLLQFALLAAAMAGLFRFVPNTHVRASHAWAGALFVALAFEVAKAGLAWYLESVPTFSAVYGAFATAPILLLWIYLAWVMVLLGAVIAAYAPSLGTRTVSRRDAPGGRFALALEMLGRLQQARTSGLGGHSLHRLALDTGIDPLSVEGVADRLEQIGWVARLEEPGEQRLVLVGEPKALALAPLVDALLLAPRAGTQGLVERSGLRSMTLADALPDAGLT